MPFHPDVDDYLSRVATAGGTVSDYNKNVLDRQIKAIYAQGLRGSTNALKYWLRTTLTESFTGCLVPVYDDGVGNATNVGSFTSADWSPVNGLSNNGSARYLNSLWNPTTKLGTLSSSSCSIHTGIWQTVCTLSPTGGGVSGLIGGAGDEVTFKDYFQCYLESDTAVVSIQADTFTGTNLFIYDNTAIGFLLNNRPSPSSARLVLNNSLLGTYGSVLSDMVSPNFNYPLMGTYDPSDTVVPARGSFKDFTLGTGLTTDQETALYNALSITTPYTSSTHRLMMCKA